MIEHRRALALAFAVVLSARVGLAEDTRTITIFEGRQVWVPVPAGWSLDERREPRNGVKIIQLQDPGKEVDLQMSFFPDPSDRLSSRAALESEARGFLETYVETSVEKKIRLTFFEAPDGSGAFARFTDGQLDLRHIPKDEKLIAVSGLRSWKGDYALFTILTNTTDSETFKKALDIVKSGIHQPKAPVAF